jgi:hypothetical protein
MLQELMWGTVRITSPCRRIEIKSQYAGSNVLQLICIVWPTGCRVVG